MEKIGVVWNKGKSLGQKEGFSRRSIQMISDLLERDENWRDLALFRVGLDTMLRACDLLELTIRDVCDEDQVVRTSWPLQQKKTQKPVVVTLTKPAIATLTVWINSSNKLNKDEYLFTRIKGNSFERISRRYYGTLVKKWARMVNLDAPKFSTHSLRRSKASIMYSSGVDLETIRILLGQTTLNATKNYLGMSRQEAFNLARQFVL